MEIKKIYQETRKHKILGLYTRFKNWLRSSETGIVLDRAFRFFVITFVTAFFANYALGQEFIPVLEASFGVALIATYDKIKNIVLKKAREEEDGFTKL